MQLTTEMPGRQTKIKIARTPPLGLKRKQMPHYHRGVGRWTLVELTDT